MKQIFVINGSAGRNSSNQSLINNIAKQTKGYFRMTISEDLKSLPHFDPELSLNDKPPEILNFIQQIESADAVLICTPEYIFSIPSGLKNALEWCVSTTVFSGKPTGIITASANGLKGHEELQLIMRTVMATFIPETTLLIQGIKGKVNDQGDIIDKKTQDDLTSFIEAFKKLAQNN